MQPKCHGCGRHPRACWALPCLVLEQALANGDRAIKLWGARSGLVIRGRGRQLTAEIPEPVKYALIKPSRKKAITNV